MISTDAIAWSPRRDALTPSDAWQVSDSFPFEWIKKKWREGFHVTAMATAGPQWAVVMSRNAGFQAQCVELDFQYSSEGIHRRWDEGARCHPRCTYTVQPARAFELNT